LGSISFGTDGIRGPFGEFPIVPEVAHRVGRAALKLARRLGGEQVLVVRDPRPSGVALARAVAAGVLDGGGVARDGGVAPTAAVQTAITQGLATVGVMITASHNPEADNGFKVLGAGGRKLDEDAVAAVERWMDDAEPPSRPGTIEDVADAVRAAWIASVKANVGDLSSLSGKRIALDLANGALTATKDLLSAVLPSGLEVVWLGTKGAVNDGVGSEHLAYLCAQVKAQGCAGGFAVDGDADRCRVVDELGREVPGDAVLWRLATDLSVTGLAVTVMSNGALERQLPGVRVVRTAVGDTAVRVAMDKEGLQLGGEESGHVLFAEHPGGDGLLCGLRTLAAAFRASPALSQAFSSFEPLPRKITKVKARNQLPLDKMVAVQRARLVGLERLGPHGRVFLRYSGTEPVLRILVEGEPASAVEAVSASITSAANMALT
jgi:phosphoglucosamine mutase